MRILVFHEHIEEPGRGGGGAESMMRDQTEAFKRLGHEVAWLQSAHIDQAVAEFKPDIVQIQTLYHAFGFGPAIWLQEHGIPHVWALMNYWPFCLGEQMLKNGDERCQECDGACPDGRAPKVWREIVNRSPVVALNRYTAEIYKRNGLHCDYVVELGIDTDLFAPDTLRRNGAAQVYTSSAWAAFPAKGMKYLREAVKGSSFSVGLLAGLPRERIADALKSADIYVFPSTYDETFGLGLCEAMASGCACVASDVAGARAQIDDGVTGLLVPPRDAGALRGAIERLIADEGLRERLGGAARMHVAAEHSLEAMGGRWLAVYESVLKGDKHGST